MTQKNPGAEDLGEPDGVYNSSQPGSWSKAWQTDPMGGALSDHWPDLIATFRSRAPLGSMAPDFKGEVLDGQSVRLSDYRDHKSVLIVFGSLACPPCVTNIRINDPNLVGLYETYGEAVEFLYLYTREGHPGSKIVPHTTMEDKRQNARRLKAEEGITFPIVIDDVEGTIQRSFVHPHFNNPVFLINRAGIVTYKSAWLDASELPQVLEDQVLWDRRAQTDATIKKSYSERIRPLREPYDVNCNKRIKRLMDDIGLPQIAMGAIPGIDSEKTGG
jgi:hypothetical protein